MRVLFPFSQQEVRLVEAPPAQALSVQRHRQEQINRLIAPVTAEGPP